MPVNEEPGGPRGHDRTESSGRETGEIRERATSKRRPGVRVVLWTVSVMAFLLGVATGALITSVGLQRPPGETDGDPGPATAEPTAPRSPAATVPPGREVSVPGECLAALDRAEQAMETIRRGLRALTDLDGPQLERVIDQLQRIQPEYQRLAERCRAEAEVRTPEPTITSSLPARLVVPRGSGVRGPRRPQTGGRGAPV